MKDDGDVDDSRLIASGRRKCSSVVGAGNVTQFTILAGSPQLCANR